MKNWKGNFGGVILQRGLNYYNSNAVRIYSSSKNHVDAQVAGSRVYDVRINLKNFKIMSMYCNCPYDGNCKHLAATLYCIEDNPKILTQSDYSDLISSLTHAELIEFLNKELPRNPDLLNKLRLFKNQPDWQYYQDKLQDCFEDYFKVLKFIDDDLSELKQIDLILTLSKSIVKYAEDISLDGQYEGVDEILIKIDGLMNSFAFNGFENQVCDFLEEFILNSEDMIVLELFTDTYSRFRSVEKLFDENMDEVK